MRNKKTAATGDPVHAFYNGGRTVRERERETKAVKKHSLLQRNRPNGDLEDTGRSWGRMETLLGPTDGPQ